MKTGRHITREISTINRIEETDIKDYYGKLPSGIVPLVLNIILFVSILLIGIFVPNEKIKWTDAFVIASYVTFSLNILWLVGRQEFFQDARYNAFSMWKKSFGWKIKEKVYFSSIDVKNNIHNSEDYKVFLLERKTNTTNLFWVSLIIHFVLIIVSTILVFVF